MKLTKYELYEIFISANITDCVLRITKALGLQELASQRKLTVQNSWKFKYLKINKLKKIACAGIQLEAGKVIILKGLWFS